MHRADPRPACGGGASYFSGVIELSPDDVARIEGLATSLLTQVGQTPNAFYGSNQRALTRVVTQLARWNKGRGSRCDGEDGGEAVCRAFAASCPPAIRRLRRAKACFSRSRLRNGPGRAAGGRLACCRAPDRRVACRDLAGLRRSANVISTDGARASLERRRALHADATSGPTYPTATPAYEPHYPSAASFPHPAHTR